MTTEQRTNLKFLVWLGKNPTEALKLLQDVYGDDAMSRARVFEWHRRFKEGKMWKIIPGAEDLPWARLRKMLRLSGRKFSEIAAWLLEWLPMSWTWILRGCGQSLRNTWGWGRSVPKWFPGCSMSSRKNGVCRCATTFWKSLKLNQTCWEEWLLVMSHGYLSMTRKRNAKVFSGRVRHHQDRKKRGCPSPKSRWCWLIFLMWGALCTQNSCNRAIPSTNTFTGMFCGVWCGQCARRGVSFIKRNHGCFTMTTLLCTMPWASVNFLPKITLLCWSNLHTHQIWLPVIFSCFQSSRESWKERAFQTYKQLKEPWRRSSERSRKNPSRSAWRHGREGWKSALELMGITLKAMHSSLRFAFLIK